MYRTYTPDGAGTYVLVGEFETLAGGSAACILPGDRVELATACGSTVVYIME